MGPTGGGNANISGVRWGPKQRHRDPLSACNPPVSSLRSLCPPQFYVDDGWSMSGPSEMDGALLLCIRNSLV